jgi:tetratricopeptide (TPR) repeat protein
MNRGLMCVILSMPLAAADIDSVRRLINEGHVQEALRQARKVQEDHPNDAVVQMQLGQLLQELAGSRVELLRQVAPNSAQAHELAGKEMEAHQKLNDALAEYKLAAAKAPSLPGIHYLLGNLYWRLGDLVQAGAELDKELALNANHSLANLRMGQVLMRMDETKPREAMPYLRKALDNPQTALEAHRELGKALRVAGQPREAIEQLKYVAERVPDDDMIHAQLAAAYRAAGDQATARHEMDLHSKILQAEHARLAGLRNEKQ